MNQVILQTKGLSKTFTSGRGKKRKEVKAVKGVDLQVYQGEIFGFLGPNGAGKTTTLQMLTTLLAPTAGEATVVGHALLKDPQKVREHIGYVSQAGGSDASMGAFENLVLQARLYGMEKQRAAEEAEKLVKRFEMQEFANRPARSYSGGQKRRLDLALGIVHRPPLVFLDEPTIGLDPQSRAYFWTEIKRLRQEGVTVFLTTHYLDEANALCDRLSIIDHGEIVALGTPQDLKRQSGSDSIILGFGNPSEFGQAQQVLSGQAYIKKIFPQEGKLHLFVENGEERMKEVLRFLDQQALNVETIELSKPSLDDVFLQKTGRSLRDQA